ncbi:hypothetical protein YPPY11_2153, partial [Yersinia pestis PY-11]
MLAGLSVK